MNIANGNTFLHFSGEFTNPGVYATLNIIGYKMQVYYLIIYLLNKISLYTLAALGLSV